MSFHPRNRHQGHYDFDALVRACPALQPFVAPTPYGEPSIDFANPEAVKTLNRALLASYYGLRDWDIPPGYLCPPIPGRADSVHAIADLLSANGGAVPRGPAIRGLDIGVGANLVYPLIGQGEYGWSFVGSDVDSKAIAAAARILKSNPKQASQIELRTQTTKTAFFRGIVKSGERFDFSICNPPFHASAEEAAAGSQRKWKNLGKNVPKGKAPSLNFGGQAGELWYPGGEAAFVAQMIRESREFGANIGWFTSLVSKESSLPVVEKALIQAQVKERRIVPMSQGQKKSRLVAWTY